MITKEFTVKIPEGLHARPSAYLAQNLLTYNLNQVIFECNGQKTKIGCSLMELLMLGAYMGSKIKVQISGNKETEAMAFMEKFFNFEMEEEIYGEILKF